MDGRKAVSSDILGLEVGRTVLRGVLLDAAGANVVNFAECPLPPTAGEPARTASADCRRIGASLQVLLGRLGLQERSVFAAGLAAGPHYSGVGSGPAITDWLQAQADGLSLELVHAGDLGVAFAPKDVVDGAVEATRSAGLSLVRVDLSPVAAARVLIDPSHDVATVGSGVGWRARLRDLEVVEALERSEIPPDAPFMVRLSDGGWESLTGYRRIAIPPGLRAAGFDPGQMAVAAGVAIGVANRSEADLLNGVVIGPRQPMIAVPATAPRQRPSVLGRPEQDRQGGDGRARPGRRPPSGRTSPGNRRPVGPDPDRPIRRQHPRRPPPAGGRAPLAPAHHTFDPVDQFGVDPGQEQTLSAPHPGLDILIGFLVTLTLILVPIYLFL